MIIEAFAICFVSSFNRGVIRVLGIDQHQIGGQFELYWQLDQLIKSPVRRDLALIEPSMQKEESTQKRKKKRRVKDFLSL